MGQAPERLLYFHNTLTVNDLTVFNIIVENFSYS